MGQAVAVGASWAALGGYSEGIGCRVTLYNLNAQKGIWEIGPSFESVGNASGVYNHM
ncbi:hypothetical protein KIPB_016943, partial [Kipferlia bialata]|eukprot:g16943.t1